MSRRGWTCADCGSGATPPNPGGPRCPTCAALAYLAGFPCGLMLADGSQHDMGIVSHCQRVPGHQYPHSANAANAAEYDRLEGISREHPDPARVVELARLVWSNRGMV